MKCVICGKTYEKGDCPVCRFPEIKIGGQSSMEDVIDRNKDAIEGYRDDFVKRLKISIRSYYWKDSNGAYLMDRMEDYEMCDLSEALGNIIWKDRLFARIENVSELELCVLISDKDRLYEKFVKIPNINAPGWLNVGVSVNDRMELKLFIKNTQTSDVSESEFVALFD